MVKMVTREQTKQLLQEKYEIKPKMLNQFLRF